MRSLAIPVVAATLFALTAPAVSTAGVHRPVALPALPTPPDGAHYFQHVSDLSNNNQRGNTGEE
ncbi:hypothetical protein GCM10020221_06260 [Streptomyces thioluteus]|uniref:Secreted protein n=1 Tax=Streptomyces thioluteus TaxID=66431 RepID=A0ABN3WEM4_STRTU